MAIGSTKAVGIARVCIYPIEDECPIFIVNLDLDAIIIPRNVMAPRTIKPPKISQCPGTSPMKMETQIGFRMGSITGINVASRAVTCRMAME